MTDGTYRRATPLRPTRDHRLDRALLESGPMAIVRDLDGIRHLESQPPGAIPAGIRFQETVSVLFRASGSPRVRRIAEYADAIRASRFSP